MEVFFVLEFFNFFRKKTSISSLEGRYLAVGVLHEWGGGLPFPDRDLQLILLFLVPRLLPHATSITAKSHTLQRFCRTRKLPLSICSVWVLPPSPLPSPPPPQNSVALQTIHLPSPVFFVLVDLCILKFFFPIFLEGSREGEEIKA